MWVLFSSCWYTFYVTISNSCRLTFTEFRSVMEYSAAKQCPLAPTKVAVFKGKRSRPKFTRNIKTGAQMKSSTHHALPPSHESFAAPSLLTVVDPPGNQPVICQGATRKKTKKELESKVRQQASAMKVLLTEKEAASKKADVLGQKYKKISVSLRSARASVREANSKKRKVEACLKSSLKKTQSNLTKAQEKSTATINCLEKQNKDKLSQCNVSHQCDQERQKVIILVSLFIS